MTGSEEMLGQLREDIKMNLPRTAGSEQEAPEREAAKKCQRENVITHLESREGNGGQ